MQTDTLIDSLVADLAPVRPRSRRREFALIAGLIGLELALFIALRDVRPDMPQAMRTPAFWWKITSFALIAGLAAAAALTSLDPATTTQRRTTGPWRALALFAPLALALGWIIDAGTSAGAPLLDRLVWRDGLSCLVNIALLTLPLALALGLVIRRGAATQPHRTAAAAGLAASGFGAFVFAFHCPHDDPLYVAIWYGGAVLTVTALSRLILPRLTRW